MNIVTPTLFARYPSPEDLAGAEPSELEGIIRSTGFFRAKAASLIGMAGALVERFDSIVPDRLEDLVSLPGVGRKTANVVLSVAFDKPGLPVDTHVGRLARRLGLTTEDDPVKVERDLCALVPPRQWGALSLRLILHGRAVCVARRPRCSECVLADVCPSASPGTTAPVHEAGRSRRTVQRGRGDPGLTTLRQRRGLTTGREEALQPAPRAVERALHPEQLRGQRVVASRGGRLSHRDDARRELREEGRDRGDL